MKNLKDLKVPPYAAACLPNAERISSRVARGKAGRQQLRASPRHAVGRNAVGWGSQREHAVQLSSTTGD